MNDTQIILMEIPSKPPLTDNLRSHPASPSADAATMLYLGAVVAFGSLAALAALLGDESRKITSRVVFAYLVAGGLASAGVVLLLVESYGFSWFLLGVSVFSGYKAVDVLALCSHAIGLLLKKFLGEKSKHDQKP